MPLQVTRNVSEGERFTRLRVHCLLERPPSLTLRVIQPVSRRECAAQGIDVRSCHTPIVRIRP